MRAGAVAVRFLVRADLELGDVGLHGVVGELELDTPVGGPALPAHLQSDLPRIGDEGAAPRVNAAGLFALFGGRRFLVELFRSGGKDAGLAVVAVAEDIIVI